MTNGRKIAAVPIGYLQLINLSQITCSYHSRSFPDGYSQLTKGDPLWVDRKLIASVRPVFLGARQRADAPKSRYLGNKSKLHAVTPFPKDNDAHDELLSGFNVAEKRSR